MKKIWFSVMFLIGFLAFIPAGFPGEEEDHILGTIVNLEAQFITVADDTSGDEVRVHYDKRTKIDGQLKVGAIVEVEINGGHAVSIEVLTPEHEEEESFEF